MRLPTVSGKNLLGEQLSFPRDFTARLNLVLVAFDQYQQREVDTWVPLAKDLAASEASFAYYEFPVPGAMGPMGRTMLDYWMRTGIPNPKTRALTVTLYMDRADFYTPLDLPDDRQIYALLIRDDGEVLWQAAGPLTDDKQAELLTKLDQYRAELTT